MNQGGQSVPSSVPLFCSSGYYFDLVTASCIVEETPCTNGCYKYCNLNCEYELEFVAYPGDCSRYYICLPGGETITNDCPSNNPYFNGTDCTTDLFQCCDSCVPYCTSPFTEIADPNDCLSFYVCLQVGVPPEENHLNCPAGYFFDSTISSCNAGLTCTSLCLGDSQTTLSTVITTESTTSWITAPALTTEQIITTIPTTAEIITKAPTTVEITTNAPTTFEITTKAPTTVEITTNAPTTVEITTKASTTVEITATTITITTTKPSTTTRRCHDEHHEDCPPDCDHC